MSIRFKKTKSEGLREAAVLVYFLNCTVGYSAEPGSEIGSDSMPVSSSQTEALGAQLPEDEKFSRAEIEESGQTEVENFTQAYEELLQEMLLELPPERPQQILHALSDSEDHFNFTETSSSASETILKSALLTLKKGAGERLTSADASNFLKSRELVLSRLTAAQFIKDQNRLRSLEQSRKNLPLSRNIRSLDYHPSLLACSPDGTRIYAGHKLPKRLDLIHRRNGAMIPIWYRPPGDTFGVQVSPDGSYLGVWFTDHPDVEIREAVSGQLVATLKPGFWQKLRSSKSEPVKNLTFSPDSSRVLISYVSYFVLWDLKTRKEIYRVRKDVSGFTSASFVSDSKFALSQRGFAWSDPPSNSKVSLWDTQSRWAKKTRKLLKLWPEIAKEKRQPSDWRGEYKVFNLLPPMEGGQVQYLSTDGEVFDFSTGKILFKFQSDQLSSSDIKFEIFASDGSNLVASNDWNPHIGIWNIKDGRLIHWIETNIRGRLTSLSFVPGRPLIIIQSLSKLKIWNMETKKIIFHIRKTEANACLSADGAALFIAASTDAKSSNLFQLNLDVLLSEGEVTDF